jgi:GDP-4-dehydro-6-deoxy-D-mannose reductase
LKVLVTGADGFVGTRLVRTMIQAGHETVAAVHPGVADVRAKRGWPESLRLVPFELPRPESVREAVAGGFDAVIHLAAIASGADARKDPGLAWRINAEGTAILAEELAQLGKSPLLLLVSTAEVYGAGSPAPRVETDPAEPQSPYAASKLGAEIAAAEVRRRNGLRVVIARPFPHTGPGQDERYVVPALARRIRIARQAKAPVVRVGNLDLVRELMHVDDVIAAYLGLLESGRDGEVYNVASGRPLLLGDVFDQLCELLGYRVLPESHPSLMRKGDIPYLVGDAGKLRADTGWIPSHTLERTLQEVVDAQAD